MSRASNDSERSPLVSQPLKRGVYARSGPSDSRNPCPLVNALANNGIIKRDGQKIRSNDVYAAALGKTHLQRAPGPQKAQLQKKPGLLTRLWRFIRNPWVILSIFALRDPGQKDAQGKLVPNLHQVGRHELVEHDVSLSRRDYFQKQGYGAPQKDLIDRLLACSTHGKVIAMVDLADFGKTRIEERPKNNPGLNYGSAQHGIACGEIALILTVFGDGETVPCSYVCALFEDQRLPLAEGWRKRLWWRTLGLVELNRTVEKVKKLIGIEF